MGVTTAVTRVACNTSTGDQTITTTDLGGLTPKSAIFICSLGVTDGTLANDAALSIGITDGTTQLVVNGQSEDGSGNVDSDRRGSNDEVIQLMTVAGAIDGEANFKNWTTNGVVITWGDAPAAAYLLTVIFFAGTDLSTDVGNHTMLWDATSSITGLGYEPDVIFVITHGTSFGDARGNDQNYQFGIGWNDTTPVQGTKSQFSDSGDATTDIIDHATNNRINVSLYQSGAHVSRSFKIDSFDSGGVTFSARQEGITSSDNITAYLTLNFGGVVAAWLGWVDTATSTGSQSITTPGFTPQIVITLPTHMTTLGTEESASSGSTGMGAFDEDDEYMTMIHEETDVETTDTGSISDDKALHILDGGGSSDVIAAFTSFDANGWTWNYSAVNATAQKVLCLAIEAEDAGHDDLVAAYGSLTFAGQTVGTVADRQLAAVYETFTFAGQTVALKVDRTLAAAYGSLTLSGQAVGLVRDSVLVAAAGTLSIAGQDVDLIYSGAEGHDDLVADAGSLTFAGQTVTLDRDYTLIAASGSLSFAGQAVGLVRDYTLTTIFAQAPLNVAGQVVGLIRDYTLTAAFGSLTFAGQTVTITATRSLTASYGSLSFAGQAVTLDRDYTLAAAYGSLTFAGQTADLDYSGAAAHPDLEADYGSIAFLGMATVLDYSNATITPDERIYIIAAESRTWTIPVETRTMVIAAEDRTMIVVDENQVTD